jgi:hypothetical protein
VYKCRYHQTDEHDYKDDKCNALYAVEKGKANKQSDGSNQSDLNIKFDSRDFISSRLHRVMVLVFTFHYVALVSIDHWYINFEDSILEFLEILFIFQSLNPVSIIFIFHH